MLSKKKGNIIIEIPIAIAIMAIISLMTYQTIVKANKAYKVRKDVRKMSVVFKGISGELMYNTDYNEFKNKINEKRTFYINEENLNLNKVKTSNVKELIEDQLRSESKYIKIIVQIKEDIINIHLSLEGNNRNNLELQNDIYLSENLKL